MSSDVETSLTTDPPVAEPVATASSREGASGPSNAGGGSPLQRVGKFISDMFPGGFRQYTMIIALLALILFFEYKSDGKMVTSANFQGLIAANTHVLILAIGMLMVIVVGHIDLAVGSTAGLVGVTMAWMAREYSLPWYIAVLVGLGLGLLIGAWQGFFLAKVGIPGFITTLAGLIGFRGAVIWISHSVAIPPPVELYHFANGSLPDWGREWTASLGLGSTGRAANDWPYEHFGLNVVTLALGVAIIIAFCYTTLQGRSRQLKASGVAPSLVAVLARLVAVSAVIGFVFYLFASGRPGTGFPLTGVVLLVLVLVYHIITERTPFGRHIYAVGGNKAAAALTGVSVPRTYFLVMLNMSLLAALVGILFTGRSNSAFPSLGNGWELDAIASVFIGGAAVSGGIGTVVGTMVGGMVMAVLNSGLSLLGVGSDKTAVIKGLVLLAAVAFDIYNKQQGRKSLIGRIMEGFSGTKSESDEVAVVPAEATTAAGVVETGPEIQANIDGITPAKLRDELTPTDE
ncbi:MAG: sugar ABC transporter permease [Propionibacteriaceae bacterium]|jgi:putative multiple sugar transport system permease protein|nr:sugar ABC transporter permease [Propionibacteriaceae bacterium]